MSRGTKTTSKRGVIKMKEEKLLEALKNIRRHMKTMLPDNYEMSAAWNIANRAIKEYEGDK